MTDEAILTKAIEKANKNGFKPKYVGIGEYGIEVEIDGFRESTSVKTIIFSHDFAKAFWKNETTWAFEHEGDGWGEAWQHHLKNMVLEPNPIKYLEQFLEEPNG